MGFFFSFLLVIVDGAREGEKKKKDARYFEKQKAKSPFAEEEFHLITCPLIAYGKLCVPKENYKIDS
jgi:hypothetical protein